MPAELPVAVVAALRQFAADGGVAVVATADAGGRPHTAPFGSVRAVSQSALRFGCDRRHDTYANLVRNPAVVVCLLLPPHAAVSVSGRASVILETMETVETDAVVEVAIEHVKDDMLPGASIVTAATYAVPDELAEFVERYGTEVEGA